MNEATHRSIPAGVETKSITALSISSGAGDALNSAPLALNDQETQRCIDRYAAFPIFADPAAPVIEDNPYRRPVDPESIRRMDFTKALTKNEILGSSALAAHRLLLNIYEIDLLFLPERDFASKRRDFDLFYSNEAKLLGEIIRPALERHVFGFLDCEIQVSGKWTIEALRSYLGSLLEEHQRAPLQIAEFILSSNQPEAAAAALLIQVGSDFLTEASASARNVLGKYGSIQSELFKIIIDDYGYGVHDAKHSTLFEKTMASCGLSTQAHAYWQYYLGSSLALANYYHYISRDHSKFFRYVGAFAFAEAMFSHTCREIARMLRAVFGQAADTYYFDEHYHIDAHHGRMAFENVVVPAVARYGESAAVEIVRGLEEVRLLTGIADEDFMAQIAWFDKAGEHKAMAAEIGKRLSESGAACSRTTEVGGAGRQSVMRVSDKDELLVVESGAVECVAGHGQTIELRAGESLVAPGNRMRAVKIVSDTAVYHFYEIEDHKLWLS